MKANAARRGKMKGLRTSIALMLMLLSAGAAFAQAKAPAKTEPAAKNPSIAAPAGSPISQRALWVDGTFSLQSYSGDYDLTDFSINGACDYFIIDNLAVGGIVTYQNLSNDLDLSALALGAHGLYAFGLWSDRNIYPFADLALGLAQVSNGDSESGIFFELGGGLNYALARNLGIVGTLHYALFSLSDYDYSGVKIQAGLVGIF
jgi:hypothetical protein